MEKVVKEDIAEKTMQDVDKDVKKNIEKDEDTVIEKEIEKTLEYKQELKEDQEQSKENSKISIWRILAYFIIYSVIGFIVETIFGLIKYGVLESRQSFLYGPFCAIYGIGAVIMIISLQYFKKSYNSLFIGGCIVGSITEYLVSFIGEAILNVKWWDYSHMPLNINGRICLLYSIFWGFLGLYLMISLNPKIDRLLNFFIKKINKKLLKGLTLALITVMFVDCMITAYALLYFKIRVIAENDINVKNKEAVEQMYDSIYNNEEKVHFINKFFGDEKMIKTFPRLKIEDLDGNIIYINTLLPDIKPYYYKLSNGLSDF